MFSVHKGIVPAKVIKDVFNKKHGKNDQILRKKVYLIKKYTISVSNE